MGKHFGELYKMRGIVTFRLSPFEQKALGGLMTKAIPNTFRRFRESFFRVAPPFLIGLFVYNEVEKEHQRLQRKNPADYENDK